MPLDGLRYALILGGRRVATTEVYVQEINVQEIDSDWSAYRREVLVEALVPDEGAAGVISETIREVEVCAAPVGFPVAHLRDKRACGGADGLPCDEARIAAALMGDEAEPIDFDVERMSITQLRQGAVSVEIRGRWRQVAVEAA